MKKSILFLGIAINLVMFLWMSWNQYLVNQQLENGQTVMDSLQTEISFNQIQIEQYRIAFERARTEMSPECKAEFEEILKTVE